MDALQKTEEAIYITNPIGMPVMFEKPKNNATSAETLNAYFEAAFRIDRTLDVSGNLEGPPNRDKIDALILQAMYTAPVFSDYFLVSEKPTPAELSMILRSDGDTDDAPPQCNPVISDDCLIAVIGGRIEHLLTIACVPIEGRVAYQVSFHAFKINLFTSFSLWKLHQALSEYGILSYADSELINKYQVNSFGQGALSYLNDPLRRRPVFITRKSTTFSRKDQHYLNNSMRALLPFGLAFKNDKLFKQYAEPLKAQKLDIVAIPPAGENASNKLLSKNELGSPDLDAEEAAMPGGLDYFLDKSPLRKPDWEAYERVTESGQHSKEIFKLWRPLTAMKLQLKLLRACGLEAEKEWNARFVEFERLSVKSGDAADVANAVSDASGLSEKSVKVQEIALDSDGYPLNSKDLAAWSQRTLGDNIVILPRARQALKKFQHPEPRRIAQALELLGGPKLRTYLGDREAQNAVNSLLLALRMRDGFSNAELLRGQFGDDYKVNYCGKPALLSKHLASISSGFNDPRLIRIYYFFDKALRKIVIGWLPTHLPTTQS